MWQKRTFCLHGTRLISLWKLPWKTHLLFLWKCNLSFSSCLSQNIHLIGSGFWLSLRGAYVETPPLTNDLSYLFLLIFYSFEKLAASNDEGSKWSLLARRNNLYNVRREQNANSVASIRLFPARRKTSAYWKSEYYDFHYYHEFLQYFVGTQSRSTTQRLVKVSSTR